MTTQEVANRLVELCRKGDYDTCYQELYSPDCVSIENNDNFGPRRIEGMEAMKKKGEVFASMLEEMYGSEIGEPMVMGNHFAITMSMDWKMKGQERAKADEICVYEVKDGKVVLEQFFY